jgi:hypothetical protein
MSQFSDKHKNKDNFLVINTQNYLTILHITLYNCCLHVEECNLTSFARKSGKSPENKPGNKLPKHYLKQHLKQSITNKEERNQVCALLCFQYIEGLFQNNIMRLQKNNQSSLTVV